MHHRTAGWSLSARKFSQNFRTFSSLISSGWIKCDCLWGWMIAIESVLSKSPSWCAYPWYLCLLIQKIVKSVNMEGGDKARRWLTSWLCKSQWHQCTLKQDLLGAVWLRSPVQMVSFANQFTGWGLRSGFQHGRVRGLVGHSLSLLTWPLQIVSGNKISDGSHRNDLWVIPKAQLRAQKPNCLFLLCS